MGRGKHLKKSQNSARCCLLPVYRIVAKERPIKHRLWVEREMVGWLDGWMIGWKDGWSVGWMDDWLEGWMVDWMESWLKGLMIGWGDE